ncbi:BQ5605_C009g05620 [Microbotryum silenes-dioicae]|uniref:BQ5605_C009g05620 protein n=1 Tax=Microbotryum silenes-dioicae TaxID=796604 RepID=A0A2X0PF22_9BASI|nr:BQ5605_C009g05620 [Microbotryum silenes-dioicae]
MRESNFSSPAHNRACVCISSALYDRRAIDAPSPSLPLVNSLTHLSYLTATSPRIREILSLDGGLERLVRILKGCAAGGPPVIEESLADIRHKTTRGPKKGPRRSPFKSFDEYSPVIDDEWTQDRAGYTSLSRTVGEAPLPGPLPWELDVELSSSLSSATMTTNSSSRDRHLLYTYTLAFQCVVNIGVRGSETIRTRVVEAGALDVVVNVLQRYLDDIARRKQQAELAAEEEAAAAATPVAVPVALGPPVVADIVLAPLTQPQLARLNNRAPPQYRLAPPARVATPDTVISTDEGSIADDNGSSSGQEGDEVMTEDEPRSQASTSSSNSRLGKAIIASSSAPSRRQDHDEDDGDVVMGGSDMHEDAATASTPRHTATSRQEGPSRPNQSRSSGLHYRDEDVLLSLQLLAYLSKYPHVRSVFHSPHDAVHPEMDNENEHDYLHAPHHDHYDSKASTPTSTSLPTLSSNVFSLVEAFTHRPASNDPYTPRHSNEVQYWAGVIMRNACRKDESRGGIRQCANMQCGVWEKYAREFAKCRRCRKAKYCSKTCQSKAWQFGHRYWCAKAAPKEGNSSTHDESAPSSAANHHQHHHHGVPSLGQAQGHGQHLHHHHHQHGQHGHHAHAGGAETSGPAEREALTRRHERRSRRDDDDDDNDYDEDVNALAGRALGGLDLAAAAAAHAIGAGLGARALFNRNRGITPRGHRQSPGTDSGATTPPAGLRTGGDGAIGGFEVNVAGMGMRVGDGALGMDENDVAHDLLVGGVFGEIGAMNGLTLAENQ